MQRIEITQEELNQGDGQFHDYMTFVMHRLGAKFSDPRLALFQAVDIIHRDGMIIRLGYNSDAAGTSVANWMKSFLGRKANISYCLPPVAYQLLAFPYLFRMPILREKSLLLTQAVIDLTPELASAISDKQLDQMERDFNEFNDALSLIARLDATTVVHLESAARRICEAAVHNALSRWESLHFVERAMKEVLEPLGVDESGKSGHDVAGTLHSHWTRFGKDPLPQGLLNDVQCSAAIRYEKSPISLVAALKAHHSSVRLAALIAAEITAPSDTNEGIVLPRKKLERSVPLELARAIPALGRHLNSGWVKLIRD